MVTPSQRINIHPSTHPPSALPTTTFDVICIGSGWAGRVLAARIVKAGYTAVIVENELVGGDCPFWACVPSKALLRSPEIYNAAKNLSGVQERLDDAPSVDAAAAFRRRDQIVMNHDDSIGLVPLVQGTGVYIVRGTGRISGVKTVLVTPREGEAVEITARLAVALCTGSVPIIPDIPGLRNSNPWTPRDATSASYVPEHLIILGGGVVAAEMATAYAGLGAKRVTIVSTSERILPRVDPEASRIVQQALIERGVEFYFRTKVTKVERPASDKVIVQLSNENELNGSELLVAVGREARLQELGLDKLKISADGQLLPVDDSLRVTGVDGGWLYAAGDINGRAPLTHSSKYHAVIAANAILATVRGENSTAADWSSQAATADHFAIPQVVFTDPIVATVGLTRSAAETSGKQVREVKTSMARNPGYNIHSGNPAPSFAQWLIDEQDRLVGATFVGTDVAELLHASTVAIVGGVKLGRLMHAIPSFPTLSWTYYDLMDAAGV